MELREKIFQKCYEEGLDISTSNWLADRILKLVEQEYESVQLEPLTEEEILQTWISNLGATNKAGEPNWKKARKAISQATIAKNQKEQLYRRKD